MADALLGLIEEISKKPLIENIESTNNNLTEVQSTTKISRRKSSLVHRNSSNENSILNSQVGVEEKKEQLADVAYPKRTTSVSLAAGKLPSISEDSESGTMSSSENPHAQKSSKRVSRAPTPPIKEASLSLVNHQRKSMGTFDYVELVRRSSEESLSSQERTALYTYVLSLPKDALVEFQRKSRPSRGIALKETLRNDLDIEQYSIHFSHNLYQPQDCSIYLKQNSGTKSLHYQICIPPSSDGSYTLTVEPDKGKLHVDKPLSIDFKLKFKDNKPPKELINTVAEMLVEGGYRHFFALKTRHQANDLPVTFQSNTLEKDTIFKGNSYVVPRALVRLRIMLVYCNGLEVPEIFKLPGKSWEVMALNTHLKQGTYYPCSDPHAIATSLKNQLQGLPPMFGKVPFEDITSPPESCWEKLSGKIIHLVLLVSLEYGFNEQELDLIKWLTDLMASVAMKSTVNKMNSRFLATLMAPNLFPLSPDIGHFVGYLKTLLSERMYMMQKSLMRE